MGHRDFKTTQIYADYAPSARAAQWVEQAFQLENDAIEAATAEPTRQGLGSATAM